MGVGDITTLALPEHRYDFWHDRAVFHFLDDPLQRARSVDLVRKSLEPGGRIVVWRPSAQTGRLAVAGST